MLKDLIASLQQAASQTEQRRLEGAETLSAALPDTPVGASGGPGRNSGRSGGSPAPTGPAGNKVEALFRAISTQESGDNYSALGVPTKYGRAYGKYQILDSNINGPGGWDKEVLGRNISLDKFLNTPRLQDKIAQGKLAQYFKQYGAKGAAKAWYAGPGNANTNSNSPQYGGPSINAYAASVLKHMRGYL